MLHTCRYAYTIAITQYLFVTHKAFVHHFSKNSPFSTCSDVFFWLLVIFDDGSVWLFTELFSAFLTFLFFPTSCSVDFTLVSLFFPKEWLWGAGESLETKQYGCRCQFNYSDKQRHTYQLTSRSIDRLIVGTVCPIYKQIFFFPRFVSELTSHHMFRCLHLAVSVLWWWTSLVI